ncbi:SDR family oxidoreductase [Winogradskyella echinorum]|uniref:SDR family oxidoreductase n=1 Tax=Winogradskyella echinorum TaxID=538189 RepID=A0ABR6Y3L7_9FLAO|nr:SDR family oxidoreductase [Winogradskyella echinorum]MBC3847328.1 SDR family oxidoreductase [Winogradskyella echinorum]MBC5751676.1 SDR family oxidoreductase [Winogradskyella echinorum]
MKLNNKVAIVTGGVSGIGLASAQLFKKEGAKVIVNARNEQRLNESKEQFKNEFDSILKADVSKPNEIERLYSQVHNTYGKIDVLYLNAGTGKLMPFEMIDEDAFDYMVDVNFKGIFYGIQKALPFLNDNASIIITTSVTNQMADPYTTAYAATKAAIASLIKTLAASLSPKGIRINAVSPGPVETPIFSKVGIPAEQLPEMMEMVSQKIPIGRIGKVSELANVALFLASDDSSFMTGSEVVCDGGYSL